MESEALAYHLHQWSITMDTYNSREDFKSFYKVISTDTKNNVEFANVIEARDYPIYGMIFHPEYQMVSFESEIKMNNLINDKTAEIALGLSQFLFKEAKKSVN